jgi:hypothetical protein
VAAALTLAATLALGAPSDLMPLAEARLTAGDPIKNAKALLRNALPINNKEIRDIQYSLEGISEALRIPGSKSLGPISSAVNRAQNTLKNGRDKIIKDFADDKKVAGLAALDGLKVSLDEFKALIEAKDKQ